jgi:SAM-dependent methyltransferase
VPRERALALVLNEIRPNWRNLSIHESSPSPTGVSVVLARQGQNYTVSQYFPGRPFGTMIGGVRNENLENQTFEDETFDIVISLDVMEHVYYPDRVISEIHRTLKPGGVYICTFPVRNYQVNGWERRLIQHEDGSREDLKEPEIHGNPVSNEGSIVTIDYGYDLHKSIVEWAPFDVRVNRFNDAYHGIIGDYTEVIVCKKRGPAPVVPVDGVAGVSNLSRVRRAINRLTSRRM